MESVIPEVQDIVLQQDTPVRGRVDRVADAYFRVFTAHPSLHQFVIREMQRNVGLLLTTVRELDCEQWFMKTITCLQEEMKQPADHAVPVTTPRHYVVPARREGFR